MVHWQPANIFEHTINLQQDTTHSYAHTCTMEIVTIIKKKRKEKITQEQLMDILTESVGTSH